MCLGFPETGLLPDCLPELASLGPGPRGPSLLAGDRSVPPRASEPLADPGIPGQVTQTRAGTLKFFWEPMPTRLTVERRVWERCRRSEKKEGVPLPSPCFP